MEFGDDLVVDGGVDGGVARHAEGRQGDDDGDDPPSAHAHGAWTGGVMLDIWFPGNFIAFGCLVVHVLFF